MTDERTKRDINKPISRKKVGTYNAPIGYARYNDDRPESEYNKMSNLNCNYMYEE